MMGPIGDETDKEADVRLGISCEREKKKEKKKTLIAFQVGKDETLRCDSCFKYLHDQIVHFYLDDDGATATEVICDACWKEENQKEEIE